MPGTFIGNFKTKTQYEKDIIFCNHNDVHYECYSGIRRE